MVCKVPEQGNFAWPRVQDGTMQLSRAQFEALSERVRRIRKQSGGLFSGRKCRRVMAQRVAPPTAAG